MKTKFLWFAFVSCLFLNMAIGQQKSKKEIKEAQKLQKQNEIEKLVNSKTFDFNAEFVQPQGGRNINVQGDRYVVEYSQDSIKSFLPYFGRAYNISYGGDDGLKFEGTPEDYTIEKKKKYYLIKTTVKGKNDLFILSLSVYYEGAATLNVNSNNRNPISFTGQIAAKEQK